MICLAIKYWFYQLCLIFLSYIYIYFTFLLCYHDSRQVSAQAEKHASRDFPVITTVAKVSRKRGLWLVVRVN